MVNSKLTNNNHDDIIEVIETLNRMKEEADKFSSNEISSLVEEETDTSNLNNFDDVYDGNKVNKRSFHLKSNFYFYSCANCY